MKELSKNYGNLLMNIKNHINANYKGKKQKEVFEKLSEYFKPENKDKLRLL
jgi:hypothetical protein